MEHNLAISILLSLVFIYIVFGWLINFYNDKSDSPTFRAVIYSARIVYPLYFVMLVFSREVMNIGWFEGLSNTYAYMWFLTLASTFLYHYFDFFKGHIKPERAEQIAYVYVTGITLHIATTFPENILLITTLALFALARYNLIKKT